ncbi:UDP-N-acetylglucosamine 2-epimerase (non-hydrolysing)/GDP/UDP-N,N'-diacetylbacillosamine 2-epimerase (hydrolysing) [Bacillus oleivorans]|uniref:UDP-N-acetylglucosamine 2-epimerase (Non-hydrolysing)/GDP/UDP-N,N'-diacetylbacillosamine 2-epimerase (Hydrolysing) n=1 Tax=Bacillus oleivorans TaxID=1448271 RepID=A0A285CZQ6_9BACI|nr:UDP-N-acetylglucosamine 2-epimerase [Bacillus oleivorans]SNX72895.1 UDP-N-acetylglucosamine 2-epimerase (non-hydrolysing)/GDP/UDP-N,N'-diacetylbacillosamine 2-epimerase (hydrolysing) [Bacillus oleivorans]
MAKRKICIITGTRAEYGLLYWLMKKIQQDLDLELQIIATGMHLSPEFGLTYKQIEEDGFIINEKVEMLLSSDTPTAVAKSVGLGTIGFSESLSRLKPDLIIILGDRFELLSVAQTALLLKIPIAHIHGGEKTFGAYDDSIRHAITKMSYLHFVSTDEHRKRVIRLGEHPSRVFNVGAPGVENIKKLNLLTKCELEESLEISLQEPLFLITHHPTTLSQNPIEGTVELLEALDHFENATIIFTKANADDHGREINKLIAKFVSNDLNKRKMFDSLGQLRYLSLLKYASVSVGNSSSGLLEAPYLKTPTVNIGDRQKGRVRPESVFDCSPNSIEIIKTIRKAMEYSFQEKEKYEIFGDGDTSMKIIEILKNTVINSPMKEFYDGE